MKTHNLSLASVTIWSLIASCLLAGCVNKRTIKHQTGVIHQISGGIVTVNHTNSDFGAVKINQTKSAFFILKTSLGDFAFTSDDTRKPERIVEDFGRVAGKLSNEALGQNGTVTISVYHEAYRNWQVYGADQRVFFSFTSPELSSFASSFWIREFLRPPSDFTPAFEKVVNVTFLYQETINRSVDKAAIGP